jgi:hypothetical protein
MLFEEMPRGNGDLLEEAGESHRILGLVCNFNGSDLQMKIIHCYLITLNLQRTIQKLFLENQRTDPQVP